MRMKVHCTITFDEIYIKTLNFVKTSFVHFLALITADSNNY